MEKHDILETVNELKQIAQKVYNYLQPYCIAIYLGGSLCENIIENAHDVDFICFSDKPVDMCHIRIGLHFYQKNHQLPTNYDFIQVRTKQKEEHAYGSYINKKMIKLVGQDIDFTFDVIKTDRQEYIQILNETVDKLLSKKIRNQKRWYQILRGVYVLLNHSYDLTDEQKKEINILHDLTEGWKDIRNKTIQLVRNIK